MRFGNEKEIGTGKKITLKGYKGAGVGERVCILLNIFYDSQA